MHPNPKILVYGYGNPGRQDDILGIRLAEAIDEWARQKQYNFIETDINYQLNIEDAAAINDKDLVIYADASREAMHDYLFTKVNPEPKVSFTMHHVTPAYIQYLSNELYQRTPESFLLHIKGYHWKFQENLSKKAESNLSKAVSFLISFLEQRINREGHHS